VEARIFSFTPCPAALITGIRKLDAPRAARLSKPWAISLQRRHVRLPASAGSSLPVRLPQQRSAMLTGARCRRGAVDRRKISWAVEPPWLRPATSRSHKWCRLAAGRRKLSTQQMPRNAASAPQDFTARASADPQL